MEELTNGISNLNVTEECYILKLKRDDAWFKRVGDNVIRYNKNKKEWFPVCKSKIPRECTNYCTSGNFCRAHQEQTIINLNEPRYYTLILAGNSTFFIEHNNIHYRYNEANNQYKPICIFIYKDEEYDTYEQCTNYCKNGSFCERHEGNVDREKVQYSLIGFDNEKYIYDILHINSSDILYELKMIGRENSELDLIFKFKAELALGIDQYRGIQIKTLGINGQGYNLNHIDNYSDNTLIVGVSIDKTKLCIFFKHELKTVKENLRINFDNPDPKIRKNIFYGYHDNSLGFTFYDKLIVDCKYSTIYSESKISDSNLKEKESLERLENICKQNNFIFEYEEMSDSHTDCIINSKKIQCKYSSLVDHFTYQFRINKTLNVIRQPYSDRDGIDFFIFENELHEFYIIPISVLIYFGYIQTCNNKGKNIIMLHQLSNINYHWSKYFINRFELLNMNVSFDVRLILDMTHIVNIFNYECFLYGIDSDRDMDNLSTNLCRIKNKIIKCFNAAKIAGLNNVFTVGVNRSPMNTSYSQDIPDYFFFRLDGSIKYYYIIPKEALIEHGIIGDSKTKGCTDLGLPIPGAETIRPNKKWTQEFVGRFDLLKLI